MHYPCLPTSNDMSLHKSKPYRGLYLAQISAMFQFPCKALQLLKYLAVGIQSPRFPWSPLKYSWPYQLSVPFFFHGPTVVCLGKCTFGSGCPKSLSSPLLTLTVCLWDIRHCMLSFGFHCLEFHKTIWFLRQFWPSSTLNRHSLWPFILGFVLFPPLLELWTWYVCLCVCTRKGKLFRAFFGLGWGSPRPAREAWKSSRGFGHPKACLHWVREGPFFGQSILCVT